MTEQPVTLQVQAHDAPGRQAGVADQCAGDTSVAQSVERRAGAFEREYATRVRRILEAVDQVLERRMRLAQPEIGERPERYFGCAGRDALGPQAHVALPRRVERGCGDLARDVAAGLARGSPDLVHSYRMGCLP